MILSGSFIIADKIQMTPWNLGKILEDLGLLAEEQL
jgi:hypothetical protein